MLRGKLAFITGCRSGIGKATLKIFAQNGANIIASIKKKDSKFLKECKNLSKKYNVEIKPVYFDLDDENNLKLEVSKVLLDQKVDILVNNGGEVMNSIFLMTPIESIKKHFQINFFSQLLITQLILKNMIKNKRGSIINLSSISAHEANEGRSAYSSSKAALEIASKSISREVGRFNIRINNIAPGLIDTKMLHLNTSKDIIKSRLSKTTLKRLGKAEEVANVILFLASDESSYMSGETIKIDGGC